MHRSFPLLSANVLPVHRCHVDSKGQGASKLGETEWPAVLGAWAAKALGNSSLRNGCIPGTPSVSWDFGVVSLMNQVGWVTNQTNAFGLQAYMVVCLDMAMDQDVDVAFAEYLL